jgi:hypothetical protein
MWATPKEMRKKRKERRKKKTSWGSRVLPRRLGGK